MSNAALRSSSIRAAAITVSLLGWPVAGASVARAQAATVSYSGQASAVVITDTTNPPGGLTLCDTGPLPDTGGSLHQSISNVDDVQSAILIDNATADVTGDGSQTVAETSIVNMMLELMPPDGGMSELSVNFAGSNATATAKANGKADLAASTNIQGLVLDGQAVVVTGKPNQVVDFPGGQVIINEQTATDTGIAVAALHIVEFGCMNGLFGAARAGIVSSGGTPPPPSECGKLTGGGWIVGTPSGAKGTFGVGGGIRRGAFWGHLEYNDHGSGMKVHATAVTGFTIDPNDPDCATINYDVTIDGAPGTATVIACDRGEPGRDDTFDLTLSNGYHAAGDLGGEQPGGGNIQMHKCPPGWMK